MMSYIFDQIANSSNRGKIHPYLELQVRMEALDGGEPTPLECTYFVKFKLLVDSRSNRAFIRIPYIDDQYWAVSN